MINTISWETMKDCIDQNPSLPYFYSTENYYTSNDPNISNIDRYYIRQEIVAGVDNETYIKKDGNSDQIDFETNYKPKGIQTQ